MKNDISFTHFLYSSNIVLFFCTLMKNMGSPGHLSGWSHAKLIQNIHVSDPNLVSYYHQSCTCLLFCTLCEVVVDIIIMLMCVLLAIFQGWPDWRGGPIISLMLLPVFGPRATLSGPQWRVPNEHCPRGTALMDNGIHYLHKLPQKDMLSKTSLLLNTVGRTDQPAFIPDSIRLNFNLYEVTWPLC